METSRRVPDGLHRRSVESLVAQIEQLGFNLIRISFSNDSVSATSLPTSVGGTDPLGENPALAGSTSLEVLDQIIDAAAGHHLRIILDRYRFRADTTAPPPSRWYSGPDPGSIQGGYPEQSWIDDWTAIARRYATRPNMVGCDLHDEPKSPSTWGDGNADLDWRSAAERAGAAILTVNSNLLVIVEGIDSFDGQPYWAGGNLRGARAAPVRLSPASQLAYSIHDYGMSVNATAPWFADPTFPNNLPTLWTDNWGYLVVENTSPVIVGAFGDRKPEMGISPDAVMGDEAWRPALMSYVAANQLSFIFWALNPSAEGKTGLLESDWQTPDPEWAMQLQLNP
jgi:endoglucanase